MRFNKLVPMVGVCAVSLMSSSALYADQYRIENVYSAGQCLDVTADGIIQTSNCDVQKKSNQHWIPNGRYPGNIENNGVTNYCMDMSSARTIILKECCNSAIPGCEAQGWNWDQDPDATKPIRNKHFPPDSETKSCVRVIPGSGVHHENGDYTMQVDGYPCTDDSQAQQWRWRLITD